MSQTTYTFKPEKGFEGAIADASPSNTRSYAWAGVANTKAGIAVTVNAQGKAIPITPTTTAAQVVGLIRHTHKMPLDTGIYEPNDMIPVSSKGVMFVTVENAVALGDGVFVRHTANGANTQIGALRGTADGANTIQLTGCRWVDGAAAGQLAQLEINLPA